MRLALFYKRPPSGCHSECHLQKRQILAHAKHQALARHWQSSRGVSEGREDDVAVIGSPDCRAGGPSLPRGGVRATEMLADFRWSSERP
jgi:hypothetical protein